ncbi:centrosome and spindle pole-associated protein 1 [Protopterus annectens]|uniref:centrosome and spindle pole-associated protein 1 n=1 Tax=Protopterus annectens TaxID=7888 RepID=UPI001CFC4498|nr:centrosome and spindle pole-associated protein 1 [Protopterus annectens]
MSSVHDKKRNEEPAVWFKQLQPENRQFQKEFATPKTPLKKDVYTSMEVNEEIPEGRQEDRYGQLNAEHEIHSKQYHRYEGKADIDRRLRRVDKEPRIYENRPYRIEEHHPSNRWHPRLTDDDELYGRRPLRFNFAAERSMPRQREGRPIDYTEYPEYVVQSHRRNSEQRLPRESNLKEASMEYEDNYREGFSRRPLSAAYKAGPQVHESHETNKRSKSAAPKDDGNFATGLLLGGSDRDNNLEDRKSRYRQELVKQMEEQRRNKRREKELGLTVAASGAIDPEKEPDRLKQFGAINRQTKIQDQNSFQHPAGRVLENVGKLHEDRPHVQERIPPERPRVAFQTPILHELGVGIVDTDSGAISAVNEDFHRGLSSTLGEMVAPRLTTVPPPPPPVLSENYRTPYDDAYYYYGARNPLDPSLLYYSPKVEGAHSVPFIGVNAGQLSENLPKDQALYSARQNNSDSAPGSHGFFSDEKQSRSKEVAQNYQDILKQQIKEKEEKKKKEREEKERYEAKLEAEMRNYNPWGKGGGGAPLKDAHGNLITDLKVMHQQNENAFKNPDAKASQDRRAVVSLDLNLATPRIESNPSPSANKISGFTFAHTSPFARGNVFSEPPSEQQVNQQETYKDFLRMQIEEKRLREEQEREKLRIEEEKEEKRLAEQRETLKREYEEEQEKKRRKEEEQRLKNEEIMKLAEQKRKEAEKKRREEEMKHDEELRHHHKQERLAKLQEEEEKKIRSPSPPIPTHRKKAISRMQRPPSTDSYQSVPVSDSSQSRSQSPPVPARRNQLRAHEEKKDVISELSELRKQLRSEQQRLEGKLMDQEREDTDSPFIMSRRKEKNADVFDMARFRIQAPVRRPSAKGMKTTNIQNIREFNELKYRDTETREEMRQAYPDPPNNDETLEIQQQAMLREQQKKLNRLQKRRGGLRADHEVDVLNMNPHSTKLTMTSCFNFIGTNGETFPVANLEATTNLQTTARERRKNKTKTLDFHFVHHDTASNHSLVQNPENISLYSSLNVDQLRTRNEQRMKRLDDLNQNSTGDDFSLADEDLHNQFTPSPVPLLKSERPDSVETVATDLWLRTGSSDTLKRFIAGQSKHENSSGNTLTFNWQGMSTVHG